MPCLASKECFWPLIASMTPEVKRNHAHVTTQRILNKFIDEIFYMVYGLAVMLSIPSRSKITTRASINKMGQSFGTLCAVFMGSSDGLQVVLGQSSGSLREVFKQSLSYLQAFYGPSGWPLSCLRQTSDSL